MIDISAEAWIKRSLKSLLCNFLVQEEGAEKKKPESKAFPASPMLLILTSDGIVAVCCWNLPHFEFFVCFLARLLVFNMVLQDGSKTPFMTPSRPLPPLRGTSGFLECILLLTFPHFGLVFSEGSGASSQEEKNNPQNQVISPGNQSLLSAALSKEGHPASVLHRKQPFRPCLCGASLSFFVKEAVLLIH
jgi:hypothetical protein